MMMSPNFKTCEKISEKVWLKILKFTLATFRLVRSLFRGLHEIARGLQKRWFGYLLIIVIVILIILFLKDPHITFAPFNIPSDAGLAFSEYTVANILHDNFETIQSLSDKTHDLTGSVEDRKSDETGREINVPSQIPPAPKPNSGVQEPSLVEVQGVSYEAFVSILRKIVRAERLITGDLILQDGNSFLLIGRSVTSGKAWQVGPHPLTTDGLQQACLEIALQLSRHFESDPKKIVRHENSATAVFIQRLFEENKPSPETIEKPVANFTRILGSPEALNTFGLFLSQLGYGQAAIEVFKKAKKLSPGPNGAKVLLNLGVAYRQKGDVEQAIEVYQEALEVNPDFIEAFNNLGYLYYQNGQYEKAVVEYKNALAKKPIDTLKLEIMNNLGNALREKGELNEAVKIYHDALDRNFQFAKAHYNLAIALRKLGRIDEADREFKEAEKQDPRLKPSKIK